MNPACYDQWRKCWENYLLGHQTHPEGQYEQQIIASIDRMASLDLDFKGYGDDSECTVSSPVFGLRARAMAYRTKGSRFYQDPAVRDGVLKCLEDFYQTQYNTDLAPDKTENWWLFEIGAPLRILDILVLLYDELEQPEAVIRKYTNVMLHFKDAYLASSRGRPETGANLMWKCHILMLIGILRHEQCWIDWANEHMSETLHYVHAVELPRVGTVYNDGFYQDGSFIQHYMFAYTGGYGKHFLSIVCGLLFAFQGQACLTMPEESKAFLYRMVKEAYLPLMYKGHMMDVARGREPSRYWCEDWAAGAIVLRALLYLRATLPTQERDELDGQLKEQLLLPEARKRMLFDFHPSAEYYVSPSLAERLRELDASSVPPAASVAGHYNYGVMCKPVHRTSHYAFSVSMYSKNIACYEKLLLESNKFWHMADGATYLYTGAGDAYSGDYYATADMQRLAGTTVERSPDRGQDPYYAWYMPEARNVYAFAGGTTLEGFGIAGMQYRGQGNGKERSLEVKKSWFMFYREIVCLGSGISSSSGNPVETIVCNDRLLNKEGRFHIAVQDGPVSLTKGVEIVIHTDRLYIAQDPEENEAGRVSCGYCFPGGADVHLLWEHRKGTWNSLEINPAHISENDHLTVWISHGVHPEKASYSYVMPPSVSASEWQTWLAEQLVQIIENSEKAHAVRHLKERVTGIHFWQEAPYTCAEIEVSTQASVMLKNGDKPEDRVIAVSDPTKLGRQITLRVLADPPVQVTADMKEMEGDTKIIRA